MRFHALRQQERGGAAAKLPRLPKSQMHAKIALSVALSGSGSYERRRGRPDQGGIRSRMPRASVSVDRGTNQLIVGSNRPESLPQSQSSLKGLLSRSRAAEAGWTPGSGSRRCRISCFGPRVLSRTVALPYRLFVSVEMVGFAEHEKSAPSRFANVR